jgi:hypothetical protein
MAGYPTSTQARFWTYAAPALAELHARRHAASIARVAEVLGAPHEAAGGPKPGAKRPRDEDGAHGADDASSAKRARGADAGGAAGASSSSSSSSPYPSLPEEQLLLRWAGLCTLGLARVAGFDRAIAVTAAALLRRFFVSERMVEYPPHELM